MLVKCKFYNRSSSGVPITMPDGRSFLIPPNREAILDEADAAAPAISRAVSSGDLVMSVIPEAPVAPVVAAPVVTPEPEVVPLSNELEAEPELKAAPVELEDKPAPKRRRTRKSKTVKEKPIVETRETKED